MARLFSIVLIVFFFFFAFTQARRIFDFPDGSVAGLNNQVRFTRSDSKDPVILLPSEKPRSEASTDDKPLDSVATDRTVQGERLPGLEYNSFTVLPLTALRFHPVNRRFPTFHNCRLPTRDFSNRRPRFEPTSTRLSVFRYDDDMVLSDQIPIDLERGLPLFPDRHHLRHHHHHHHPGLPQTSVGLEKVGAGGEVKEAGERGLLMGIRKFFNQLLPLA